MHVTTDSGRPNVFRPDTDNKPVPLPPVATLEGVGFLSHTNVCLIAAGWGVGKSAIMESLAAAALCSVARTQPADTLGIAVTLPKPAASIAYFDGERSPQHTYAAWERVRHRAGVAPAARTAHLLEWAAHKGTLSMEARKKDVEKHLSQTNGVGLILLDGAADFVLNPNDVPECREFSLWLAWLTETYSLSIATTLHTNPADVTGKGRGHLGAELGRVAESAFFAELLPDGTRRMTTAHKLGKNRDNAPATGHFAWDNALGMFTRRGPTDAKATKPTTAQVYAQIALELFADGTAVLPAADISQRVAAMRGISPKAAYDWTTKLAKAQAIRKVPGGYSLP